MSVQILTAIEDSILNLANKYKLLTEDSNITYESMKNYEAELQNLISRYNEITGIKNYSTSQQIEETLSQMVNSYNDLLTKIDTVGSGEGGASLTEEQAQALQIVIDNKDNIQNSLFLNNQQEKLINDILLLNDTSYIRGDNLYDITSKTSLFDLETFQVNSIPDGLPIYENDTSVTKYSNMSLKLGNLTHGSSSRLDLIKDFNTSYDFTDLNFFTFWLFVPDEMVSDGSYSSDYGEMRVFFANSDGVGLGCKFISLYNSIQVGWNNITIKKDSFNIAMASGDLDWSNITKFRIQFNTGVGNIGVPIYLDSLFCGGSRLEKTPVVITLDDSFPDTYPMTKIFNQYGITVSNFIIPSFIDNEEHYLNIEHIKDLYNNGNHIGIHGTGLNDFAVNPDNIIIARDWLFENGFTRNDGHLYGTYPNGTYSQSTIDLLGLNGFKGFRTVAQRPRDDLNNVQSTKGKSYHECILNGGIAEPFKINGLRSATYDKFVEDIELAISSNTAYIGYYHLFSEVDGIENWVKMARYLKSKIDEGVIECISFPHFCEKYRS